MISLLIIVSIILETSVWILIWWKIIEKRLRLSPNKEDAVDCNVDHFDGLETNE